MSRFIVWGIRGRKKMSGEQKCESVKSMCLKFEWCLEFSSLAEKQLRIQAA